MVIYFSSWFARCPCHVNVVLLMKIVIAQTVKSSSQILRCEVFVRLCEAIVMQYIKLLQEIYSLWNHCDSTVCEPWWVHNLWAMVSLQFMSLLWFHSLWDHGESTFCEAIVILHVVSLGDSTVCEAMVTLQSLRPWWFYGMWSHDATVREAMVIPQSVGPCWFHSM